MNKKTRNRRSKNLTIRGLRVNTKIIERKLNIRPDYQYKALNSRNFLQSNWHRNKLFVLQKILNLNKNLTLLDLGTGSGNLELFFANKVKKIIGVDYNDEALMFLRKILQKEKIGNVALIQSDIRQLYKIRNLPNSDLILMIDVIEHLKIKDVKKLVGYFPKILNKNGKVVIITPNYKSVWPIMEILLETLHLAPKFTNSQHLSKMDKDVLKNIFEKNNFKVEQFRTFNLISFVIPSRNISEAVCKLEISLPTKVGNLIAAVFSRN